MISLDKEQICLLELIKASLFKISPDVPENVNWDIVFDLAKAQCIVPLVSSVVPEEHKKAWFDVYCQYKAHFMQLIYTQSSMVHLLKSNNIPFVILKGTAAAIYYPNPSFRSFGDIDLYVSKEHLDAVLKLFRNDKYVFVSNDDRHYEFEKNGLDIELHSRFSCEYYKDIDHLVLLGVNDAIEYKIGSYSFPGLPSYANGLVLLGHIMQHLKGSGIGLRQIIDWMMFVNKELNDSAWRDNFQYIAAEAGLEKLAITITYLCKKWFEMPSEITWCNNVDEEVVDQLLILLFEDGNLGFERAPYESIKLSSRKEGKFKYLQQVGIENWPLAQKYAVFRSLAWLYQLFKYAGIGIAGLFTGKKVFMKYKHNMSLEELWDKLD